MYNIFKSLKSFHCCVFFDHEKGAIFIGVFYILVAFATSAWQVYEFSIPLVYWQVLSLVKNLGLIMGVVRKKIEYFLPWLVVMVAVILIGPVVIIFKFLEYQDTRDDLLGPVILGVGMSLWIINMYLWSVVFSLFNRYTDDDDPISPNYPTRKNKRKSHAKNKEVV